MNVTTTAQTDLGLRREINEDYYGASNDNQLIVVCDGMGGHNAGEVASRTAVETILDAFHSLTPAAIERVCPDFKPEPVYEITRRLIAAIRLANFQVHTIADQNVNQKGMGTTVVAVHLDQNYIIVAHAGDSRAYRLRDNHLEQMTTDHTWDGNLNAAVASQSDPNLRKSNVITRAVGIDPVIKLDLLVDTVIAGDRYLLCSDGLSATVTNQEIAQILTQSRSDQDAIQALISLANERGGPDNITVAAATVTGVDTGFPQLTRLEMIVPEPEEISKTDQQRILANLPRRPARIPPPIEKPARKKNRLPLILVISGGIAILILIALKIFGPGEMVKEQPVEQTAPVPVQPDSTPVETAPPVPTPAPIVETRLKFFALDRDNAQVSIDQGAKFLLKDLKADNYSLQLPPGPHQIEVEVAGYQTIKKKIRLKPGKEIVLDIETELEKQKK